MKKRILVILIVFIISVILKSNLNESAVGVQAAKVEVSVMEKLEKEKEVSVIVLLKDGDIGIGDKVLSTLSSESLDEDFKLGHRYSVINGFSGEITKKGLEKLKNNPKVAGIYLDKIYHILLDTSVPLINADDVWNLQLNGINITGKDQTVCIIDTGIDYAHPNLGGCTQEQFLLGNCNKIIGGHCYCRLQGGCCPNDKKSDRDIMDDEGHGTHIAGIIASDHVKYKGVAPDANLIAIKVCNSEGKCAGSDVIAGIEWCIDNATKFNISVIGMSLGGDLYYTYCDDEYNNNESSEVSLTKAINSAIAQNVTVVAATGNNGSTTQIAAPACIQNVTAFSASDDNDAITSFSNRNNITDLLAPGALITSTIPGGYDEYSGTSMAAPHVAGAVALVAQFVKEQNGTVLTPAGIETVLKNTGKQINDLDSGLNFSRIDVYSAVLSLDSVAPIINLISPVNNSNSTNFLQEFNFTVTDIAPTITCNLTINGSNVNTTIAQNNMSTTIKYTFSEEGIYQWNITCWDKASNTNTTETRILTIIGAPIITLPEIFPPLLLKGENITISANIGDVNGVDAVWYNITNSTGLVANGIMSNLTNNQYGATYNTTNLTFGKYNVTIHANDTLGMVANNTMVFEIAEAMNITTKILDYKGNATNVSIKILYNGTQDIRESGEDVNEFTYSNLPRGFWDIMVEAEKFNITFKNVNVTTNLTANISLDENISKEKIILPIEVRRFIEINAIETTLDFSLVELVIPYNSSGVNQDEISVYACHDWNLSSRDCSGDNWENITSNSVINTVTNIISINITRLSAFSVAENKYCGDGICSSEVGESCSTCQVDCGECSVSGPTGGGGGGGSSSTAKIVICIENWKCSEWSGCSILSRKVRACTDLNKCGTVKNKPMTIQPCVYVALVEEKIEEKEEVKNVTIAGEEVRPVPITGGVVRNFLLGSRVGLSLLVGVIVVILTVLTIYFLRKKTPKGKKKPKFYK